MSKSCANPNALRELANYNHEDVRRIGVPAANGIGTARAVAQLYGDAATGGKALGLTAGAIGGVESERGSADRGSA